MILKFIIVTTLLAVGAHSTTSYTLQSAVPNTQHISHVPNFENQMTAWSYHQPLQNYGQSVNGGLPFYQQPMGGVVDTNKYQQSTQFQTGIAHIDNEQPQPSPVPVADAVQPSNEHVDKVEQYPVPFLPTYEDQVTVLPFLDEVDSGEEQEVWPPVGIYPPPPPPPVGDTYYPPYYPVQYPVVKPPIRPTRPTPTRPPKYPSLYPTPPYYPQYPLEELPHFPHYPLLPRPTTQRPSYTTTKPIYTKPVGEDVAVLQNYQVISDKGISKYKLQLSNGLTDFKEIIPKQIGKKIIYVQTGYYSVPVDPDKNKFNLIYYIADERGYRIKGVQTCSNENPCKVLNE